ncbi:hypothetical protein ACNPNP_04380 [Microbacterium sp. AGC85]
MPKSRRAVVAAPRSGSIVRAAAVAAGLALARPDARARMARPTTTGPSC